MADLFTLFIELLKNIISMQLFIHCFCMIAITALFNFVRWRMM